MNDPVSRRVLRESVAVTLTNLVAMRQGSFGSLPSPADSPRIVIEGPDPDRILLAGSGVVTGYGIASHSLGVGGHLARYLGAATGHGVVLDVVPLPSLLLRFAPAHFGTIDLSGYAAVILAVGVNDSFGFTTLSSWRRSLTTILGLLKDRMSPGGQIFLVAIADPTSSPLFRDRPARRAGARAHVLNQETRRVVRNEPNVTTLEFEIGDVSHEPRLYDASSYQRWARQLSPPVVEGLLRRRSLS
ncbi:hypothetical protein [Lacisediminihabitans sp. H27-G8]|uniref:hypothetical protein n=1 Tax=Lacisediminihabitans sp. H27-G8 TaxID=3111909 RepID=UPI0038FD3BA9